MRESAEKANTPISINLELRSRFFSSIANTHSPRTQQISECLIYYLANFANEIIINWNNYMHKHIQREAKMVRWNGLKISRLTGVWMVSKAKSEWVKSRKYWSSNHGFVWLRLNTKYPGFFTMFLLTTWTFHSCSLSGFTVVKSLP